MIIVYLSIVLALTPAALAATASPLTRAQKREIGLKIWHNEGGQKYENLAFWNKNEPFPSCGIGHFIWYPAGTPALFDQTFPALLDYLMANKIAMPAWLMQARTAGAPWVSKEAFDKSPLVKELRELLQATIDLQAAFCIERLHKSWPSIRLQIKPAHRARIDRYFKQLLASPQGAYALIDYLNFKGPGTNPNEQYNGKGWGLLQAIQALPAQRDNGDLVHAFADAAEKTLKERVANAPAEKKPHEERWLTGWLNRVKGYYQ